MGRGGRVEYITVHLCSFVLSYARRIIRIGEYLSDSEAHTHARTQSEWRGLRVGKGREGGREGGS